eukprot:s2673_g2.t1
MGFDGEDTSAKTDPPGSIWEFPKEETENEVYAHFLLEPVQGNLSGRTRPARPPPLTLTGSSATEPQI